MDSKPEPNKEAASPHLVSLLHNALGAAQDSATGIRAALDALGRPGTDAIGLRSAIKDAFLILHARYEAFGTAGVLLTPWSEINANLPRISAGETLFVVGPNDIRRSTFVLQVAQHVARTTKRAVYVSSASLSPVELALQLIAMSAALDEHDLELGRLSDEEWSRISTTIAELSVLDIRFLRDVEWSGHGPIAPRWPLGQEPQLLTCWTRMQMTQPSIQACC
jgi:replicative DNA helicase